MINSLKKEIDNLEIIYNHKEQIPDTDGQDTIAESLLKMGKTQSGEYLFYEKLSLTDILTGEGEGLELDENNTWIVLIKIDKNEFTKIEKKKLLDREEFYKDIYVDTYNSWFDNEYIRNLFQADWGPTITNDYGDADECASINFEIWLQYLDINYSKEYLYKTS